MAKRKVATLLVALGSIGGAVAWRRHGGRRSVHVDLYFADGSMVSFGEQAPEATQLFAAARRVLAQAR